MSPSRNIARSSPTPTLACTMQQIIPFWALLLRLEIGEKTFFSDRAWNNLKKRSRLIHISSSTFASSQSSRGPHISSKRPRLNQVANAPQTRVLDDKSGTKDGAATTPAKNEREKGGSNSAEVDSQKSSLGFSRLMQRSQTQAERDRKACREKTVRLSVGTLFIAIGIFIGIILPVQIEKKHCEGGGWQDSCLLWAHPLLTLSSCPCTMLDYKCGVDSALGWEHAEVLFGCKANASDYDLSSYTPTTVRSCDSNEDCASFEYCNAKGHCNVCRQCEVVRIQRMCML